MGSGQGRSITIHWLLTRYEYNAVLGQHVVLMDTHLDIDSLECETTSAFPDSDSPPPRVEARDSAHVSSRKNPKQPPLTQPLLTEPKPAPPLEKAHSKNDFSLEIEVTVREPPKSFFSPARSKNLLVKGALVTGAAQWGDCKHNATHRRGAPQGGDRG
eukprot:1194387-Prorocentrum_minimum.AAC.4